MAVDYTVLPDRDIQFRHLDTHLLHFTKSHIVKSYCIRGPVLEASGKIERKKREINTGRYGNKVFY